MRPRQRFPCCVAYQRLDQFGSAGRRDHKWPNGSGGRRVRPYASSTPSRACGRARGVRAHAVEQSQRCGRTWRGRRQRGIYAGIFQTALDYLDPCRGRAEAHLSLNVGRFEGGKVFRSLGRSRGRGGCRRGRIYRVQSSNRFRAPRCHGRRRRAVRRWWLGSYVGLPKWRLFDCAARVRRRRLFRGRRLTAPCPSRSRAGG